MIGYVTLGTNDPARALAFYDALLGPIGATRLMALPENDFTLFGTGFDAPMLAVTRPYDGGPATPGNGNMTALLMPSREAIEAIHARALALGGICEGPPGMRDAEMGFYAAYFRDLDGNKLCAYRIER